MNLILLGAPGVGKGTQAKLIMKKFNIPQISTGDILRSEIQENSELGQKVKDILEKGELVSDKIILEIVRKRLAQPDCTRGFILDGFPRTIAQTKGLEQILSQMDIKDLKVIEIYVAESEIIRRLTSRRICSNCGKDYNLIFNPPPPDGKCVICRGKIIQRDDDKQETIQNRLKVYQEQTKPLIDFYIKKNRYFQVDGLQSVKEVFASIEKILI
jgi:adenylate kinase